MIYLNPLRTGIAFAATIAFGYSVCAILFALWPGPGIEFLNALFHGLDFHKLETTASWTMGQFLMPLAVLTIWGLAAGTLFAWLLNLLHRTPTDE